MQPAPGTPRRPNPLRQLLFPYSGEEPLTRTQGLRVIVVWALFFSAALLFCTFPVTLVAGAFTWHRITLLLLISFLSGVVVFGSLAWVVVAMSNRAAHIIQSRKNARPQTPGGGRYGS